MKSFIRRFSSRRAAAIATTVIVSVMAGYASYWHVTDFVTQHNQGGVIGHCYAIFIDGPLIIASLNASYSKEVNPEATPLLAYVVAGCGVFATLFANVSVALPHGVESAVVSALPAAAFAGAYELLLKLLKPVVTVTAAGVAAAEAVTAVDSATGTEAVTSAPFIGSMPVAVRPEAVIAEPVVPVSWSTVTVTATAPVTDGETVTATAPVTDGETVTATAPVTDGETVTVTEPVTVTKGESVTEAEAVTDGEPVTVTEAEAVILGEAGCRLTRRQMAEMAGVSESTVYRDLSKGRDPLARARELVAA